jgi:hypothetical protein
VFRLKVQRGIDQIKKEELQLLTEKKGKEKLSSEKVEKLKKLEAALAALPAWPHYAELEDVAQFDATKGEAAQVLVTEALRLRADLEASIRKKVRSSLFLSSPTLSPNLIISQHFEDPKSVDDAKENEQRKSANNKIQSALRLCLDNLRNPKDLYALAKTLKEDPGIQITPHSLFYLIYSFRQLPCLRCRSNATRMRTISRKSAQVS